MGYAESGDVDSKRGEGVSKGAEGEGYGDESRLEIMGAGEEGGQVGEDAEILGEEGWEDEGGGWGRGRVGKGER